MNAFFDRLLRQQQWQDWLLRLAAGWLVMIIAVANLQAQVEEPHHAELKWYTIETEHFYVHFHEGAERTARVVAKVAEDVYEPITELYQFKPPKKVHFIIRDHDDYSNGAAYYYDNKIEIWASAMDFELRGTHNWLRNVVTHEFVHMIQMQVSRKMTVKIPAIYLQLIGYEKETRPDVLYGYPNKIISYPIAMTVIPSWFAEGVAQYQVPGLRYDYWDSHRDMLLRTAVLENKMLSFDQMSSFGKNSIGNERAYNQGYAFVAFLAKRYGILILRKAAEAMRAPLRFSFSQALKKATGKSGYALYREWKAELQQEYTARTMSIREHLVAGEIIESRGIGNFYPRWSPDGRKLAYLTTGGADFLSQTALVIRDMDTGKKTLVKGGVSTAFDWSPDGRFLVYAKKTDVSRHGSRFYDLYLYDLKKKKEIRLTRDARAHSPAFSPDGRSIVFVVNRDGTRNLARMPLDSRRLKMLTRFKAGEQVYQPRWAMDGASILFAMSKKDNRDVYRLHLETGRIEPVIVSKADNRNAVFGPNGHDIYFASDRSGIFNIYRFDPSTGETEQLSNVLGGAFMPTINEKGQLVFASFVAEGYKLSMLERPQPVPEPYTLYKIDTDPVQMASTENGFSAANIEPIRYPHYDDSSLPDTPAKPYRDYYQGFSFLPRIMRDYGTTKLGTYLYSSDVLGRYAVLGGFAINRDRDYDLFALIDYHKLGPTLFLEAYNQVRHSTEGADKFTYNLGEVDLGVRGFFPYRPHHRYRLAFVFSRYSTKIQSKIGGRPTSFSATYFIGRTAQFRYTYEGVAPALDMHANPRSGRRVMLEYDREWNKFITGFEVNTTYGTLQEVYANYNFNKLYLDWREYVPMPFRHGLMLRLRAGYIDKPIDSFFNFFAGGLDGIRGYPFYSIEGRKLLQATVAYRLPLLWDIDFAMAPLYFDKLFFGVFFDYGDAYDGKHFQFSQFKKAAGVQIRLDMFSFYSFPTRVFFDAAYGFDEVHNRGLRYGKEWRYYFGITFGYLD
ncbi:MAG: DPP IV N-terminal domain-containing protein [candidate division KSB1 bacterium]|nr:DPP IV N-terminal domain-containing protein [candidate division KSB1 bacterium]